MTVKAKFWYFDDFLFWLNLVLKIDIKTNDKHNESQTCDEKIDKISNI